MTAPTETSPVDLDAVDAEIALMPPSTQAFLADLGVARMARELRQVRAALAALGGTGRCETYTSGACIDSRYACSPYGIHQACPPCVARAALEGRALTVHPPGPCETCGADIPEG